MKKEFILLAVMTSGPYLLNSAGNMSTEKYTDTIRAAVEVPSEAQFEPIPLFEPDTRLYWPIAAYEDNAGFTDTVERNDGNSRASRVLKKRNSRQRQSAIKANWILDTAASELYGAPVYVDKDNPELRAIIGTDESGNMIIKLERNGKIEETPVDKIEFYSGSYLNRRVEQRKALGQTALLPRTRNTKHINDTRKGGYHVPV